METRIIKVGESQIDFYREEDQTYLTVKPACEILNIDYPSQFTAIKKSKFLAPTIVGRTIVAKDGKEREMVHLPFHEFIWWLVKIDSSKVKAENQEAFANNQYLIHKTVLTSLNSRVKLYQAKEKAINEQLNKVDSLSAQMEAVKKHLNEEKKKLNEMKEMPVDEFGQQSMFTENQQKGIEQ